MESSSTIPDHQQQPPKPLSATHSDRSTGQAVDLLPIPPDGGYGWVIVVVCFCCSGLVEGCVGSFGIFLPFLAQSFETSQARTAMAGSLLIGGFLVTGPVVSVLINCFGCRVVTICGALLTSAAFSLSTLCKDINAFIGIYGFFGGIGLAMIYLPSMVMVGFYFERRRSLATGIAYSGAGIGMMIMAPAAAYLLSHYDWRNALLLFTAFPLQGIILGALMRPLTSPFFNQLDKKGVRTVRNIALKLSNNLTEATPKSSPAFPQAILGKQLATQSMLIYHDKHDAVGELKHAAMASSMTTQSCLDLPMGRVSQQEAWKSHALRNRNRKFIPPQAGFISCQLLMHLPEEVLTQINLAKLREELSKPLARRDIFYSGNICALPEYRSQPSLADYVASVTLVPHVDLQKPVVQCCPCLSRSALATFQHMIQLELLSKPAFAIICLASTFIQLGYFIPIVFIANYAADGLGVDQNKGAILISAIGLSNTLGRFAAGALDNISWVNSLHLNNVSLFISGFATVTACFVCQNYVLLFCYAITFGYFMGAFVPLTTVFLVQYLGLSHLNNAMGLLSMVRGIWSVAGPPIAGLLLDRYHSFQPVFIMAGTMFLLAGSVFYLLSCHSHISSPCCSSSASSPTADQPSDTEVDVEEASETQLE